MMMMNLKYVEIIRKCKFLLSRTGRNSNFSRSFVIAIHNTFKKINTSTLQLVPDFVIRDLITIVVAF